MKTAILAVGKAKAPFAEAEAHYVKMLSRYQPVSIDEARDDDALISRLGPARERGLIVALDRRGREMDSMDWSMWLEERRLEARDLTFLIGGPAGLPDEALEAAGQAISMGPQTMAHQLARVVLLEQLFRATKILAGEPYHL